MVSLDCGFAALHCEAGHTITARCGGGDEARVAVEQAKVEISNCSDAQGEASKIDNTTRYPYGFCFTTAYI
jgi:hypothetical protein